MSCPTLLHVLPDTAATFLADLVNGLENAINWTVSEAPQEYVRARRRFDYSGGGLARRFHRALAWRFPTFGEGIYELPQLQRGEVDLVHAHYGYHGVYALKLAHRLKVPLVTSFHGYDLYALRSRRRWVRAYARLFARGDLFCVVGGHMWAQLALMGCPERKIRLQAVGVDTVRFRPAETPPAGPPTVIMISRMVEKKGFDDGLRAVARARERVPELRLVVVGDGEWRAAWEALARRLLPPEAVRFTGWLAPEQVAAEIRACLIGLVPSRTARDGDAEGVPSTVKELALCGLACVATRHSDLPEVIQDGISGRLVAERDVAAMAQALVELAGEPEKARALGGAAREHCRRRFDLKQQNALMRARYADLLAGRSPR